MFYRENPAYMCGYVFKYYASFYMRAKINTLYNLNSSNFMKKLKYKIKNTEWEEFNEQDS